MFNFRYLVLCPMLTLNRVQGVPINTNILTLTERKREFI